MAETKTLQFHPADWAAVELLTHGTYGEAFAKYALAALTGRTDKDGDRLKAAAQLQKEAA